MEKFRYLLRIAYIQMAYVMQPLNSAKAMKKMWSFCPGAYHLLCPYRQAPTSKECQINAWFSWLCRLKLHVGMFPDTVSSRKTMQTKYIDTSITKTGVWFRDDRTHAKNNCHLRVSGSSWVPIESIGTPCKHKPVAAGEAPLSQEHESTIYIYILVKNNKVTIPQLAPSLYTQISETPGYIQ